MRNIASKTVLSNYADENQRALYKKFPSTHYLSNQTNVFHVLAWNTFFRRNLHRLAIDYLKINLHTYQAIMLYLMGICQFIVVIASRAAAKSFIIALYACCRCITRPNSEIVLASATQKQSKLIITRKIEQELMGMSPVLKQEIKNIRTIQNEYIVNFRNGSTIRVVTASESGRGNRSTCLIREEYRQIQKKVDDSILSPFQYIRTSQYMLIPPYSSMEELQEEPVDIYISSSWYDDGHWMWNIADQAEEGMKNSEAFCLLAFDESITLKHNIKTRNQLIREKKKQDPLTWRIEFLNERVKQNTSAYFEYKLLTQCQTVQNVFYPQTLENYKSRKKNPFSIEKQPGEVRIVACDMAFVDKTNNDKSVYSCIRALPETITYYDDENNNKAIVAQGYRRIVSYMESHKGTDNISQAVRIRQLFEDFKADYIVLDMRNGGIHVFYSLAKTLYDEVRGEEYSPLTCMNDDKLANAIKISGAKPCIYAVYATQDRNSDIAIELKKCLHDETLNLPVSLQRAKDEFLSEISEYSDTKDIETELYYEMPFLESQLFINEASTLLYERLKQTGAIKIYEQGGNQKDRYTSVSYGNYFVSLLEKDLFSEPEEADYSKAPNCISEINF